MFLSMASTNPSTSIRPATKADLPFILSLIPRLIEFDLPPWREPEAVRASSEKLLRDVLSSPPAGSVLLLAEFANGEPVGFIHLETTPEFFTGEMQGYVANLAVKEASAGKGVGRALMDAAGAWTREQGMQHLTLYVFAQNSRARTFYARLGFEEDSLKLAKEVR